MGKGEITLGFSYAYRRACITVAYQETVLPRTSVLSSALYEGRGRQ